MNQSNKQARPNRKKTNSGYRRNTERNGFKNILLFYVLPFIVVNGLIFILATARPKAIVTVNNSTDYISTTIDLKIKSLLPIQSMVVDLNSIPIEVTKTGSNTYTAKLNNNGSLKVELTSMNKMMNILTVPVNVLDDTPPSINNCKIENGFLSFQLEDTQSGTDFSSVSACTEDTPKILPESIDRNTGLVTFEYKDNLHLIIKDKAGNELHESINPKGECVEEDQTTETN